MSRALSARILERLDIARTAKPNVFFHGPSNRFVVYSLEFAAVTAHAHYNVMTALRKALSIERKLVANVYWDTYETQHGRYHECAYLGRNALTATFRRMHAMGAYRNMREIEHRYVALFDQAEQRGTADPAPDDEIKPPLRERPDLFAKAVPGVDSIADSWVINRAVNLLTSRGDMPDLLRTDLIGWNDDRRERQRREIRKRGGGEDEIAQIFALRKPE